jgi:catechol 2,3-dioxygenase-like lactoylglutathione lyase family enzyme
MEGKIMEIDCIGLFVNNMEKMVKFYRDIIGFETDWHGDPYAEFKAGNCLLIMFGRNDFENMVSKEFNYPKGLNGTVEIAFNLKNYDEVDKEYKRLVGLGVESVFPPTTMPWGQRTCYVADPEGNLLDIGSFGIQNGK